MLFIVFLVNFVFCLRDYLSLSSMYQNIVMVLFKSIENIVLDIFVIWGLCFWGGKDEDGGQSGEGDFVTGNE